MLKDSGKQDVFINATYAKLSRFALVQSNSSQVEYISAVGSIKNFFSDHGISDSELGKLYDNNKVIRESNLYTMVNKCNKQNDPTYLTVQSKKDRLKTSFGFSLGYDFSEIKVIGEGGVFFKDSGISGARSLSLSPSIRWEVSSKRKLSFFTEGTYRNQKYTSSKTSSGDFGGGLTYTDTFSSKMVFRILELNMGFKYNFKLFRNLFISPVLGASLRGANVPIAESTLSVAYSDGRSLTLEQNPVTQESHLFFGAKFGIQITQMINKEINVFAGYSYYTPVNVYFLGSTGTLSAPTEFNVTYSDLRVGLMWNISK